MSYLTDVFRLKDYWNPYTYCEAMNPHPLTFSKFTTIHLSLITFFACVAAFGLTNFVQHTVSLKTRMYLMKLSHCLAGFFWMLALTVCSPWTFPLIVATTYLWGSEPYDNVFSPHMWRVVMTHKRKGVWMHFYWAVSSLILHLWFVYGAAAITLGVDRPEWIGFAIIGFTCSHFARLFAYEYMDTIASVLEVIGVSFLTVCVVVQCLHWVSWKAGLWLIVSVVERYTHLPAAFQRNAHWMRSYDLWLAAVREVPECGTAPDDEQGTPTSVEVAPNGLSYTCVLCRRTSDVSSVTIATHV